MSSKFDLDPMAELHLIAHAARIFLASHWPAWHQRWGPPPPVRASQWTCIRSSLFVQRVFTHAKIGAVIASGVPAEEERYGFFDGRSWNSHAWVCTENAIVDVTADQFSAADVIVTPLTDCRYRQGLDPKAQLYVGKSAIMAVDEIWPAWTKALRSA